MTITVPRLNRLPAQERGITIADFLVPIRVSEGIGVRVRHLALILAGTLLIALAARVYFFLPGDPVPYTGQTFAVLLAGGALGFRRGIAASGLYLLLGIVGLPVYANSTHGWEIVTGATGGYLVGFVVAAGLVGRLAELGWDRRIVGSIGAMMIGDAVIFAIGVPWLAATTGQPLDWAVANGLTPFLGAEALKLALAAAAFPAAWWLVGRRPGDR
ncbi:MAG: biotin transporter BioY [Chloroflexota bacterium]|nr:MAG: biotin transporter BioY [Chloroflexota bacterium]